MSAVWPVLPTAQALRADTAATPERPLPAGAGLGTFFQAVPFQCAIKALGRAPPLSPTAQAFRAEVAATPRSSPLMTKDAARSVAAARVAAVAEERSRRPLRAGAERSSERTRTE